MAATHIATGFQSLPLAVMLIGCGHGSAVVDGHKDAPELDQDGPLQDVLTVVPSNPIAPALFLTCARPPDSTVKCWGYGVNGTLGNGSDSDSLAPVSVIGLTGVLALAAGEYTACVIAADQSVRCWGNDFQGELGDGGIAGAHSNVPVAVPDVSKAVQVTVGSRVCALLANTTVMCWGGGSTLGETSPARIPGLVGVAAMSPESYGHECVLMTDRSVKCWGQDYVGQLGDGRTGAGVTSEAPVSVMGVNDAIGVAIGSATSCALLADTTVVCWGDNTHGRLGNGSSSPLSTAAVPVSDLSGVAQISLGDNVGCAALSNGTVKCWGDNSFGELGNGSTSNSSIPVQVSAITTAVGVVVGNEHVCAQMNDGTFVCWGGNRYGQLGQTSSIQCPQEICSTVPIIVPL